MLTKICISAQKNGCNSYGFFYRFVTECYVFYDFALCKTRIHIVRCRVISYLVSAVYKRQLLFFVVRYALRLFVDSDEAIYYGNLHGQTVALFFFLLAFSHCAAGVLRGYGKSVIPMVTMLAFWCGTRIVYVTTALKVWPVFQTISWAYPLTWFLSSAVLLVCMLRTLQSRVAE